MTRGKWKIDVVWAAGGAPSGGELQQSGGRGGGGKGMANLASKTRCCTGVSLTSSNIPTPILVTTNNQERGSLYPLPQPEQSLRVPPLLGYHPVRTGKKERNNLLYWNGLFAEEPVLRRLRKCGEQQVSSSYPKRRPSAPSPPCRLSEEELPSLDLCMPGAAKPIKFHVQSCFGFEIVVTCICAPVLKHWL